MTLVGDILAFVLLAVGAWLLFLAPFAALDLLLDRLPDRYQWRRWWQRLRRKNAR